MSRELIFYPAFKDSETHKFIPLLYNINKHPADILWRSQSFIDMDFFTQTLRMISIDEIGEEFDWVKDRCNEFNSDATYMYELPIEVLDKYSNKGMVSGYALLDEALAYYNNDWPSDYLHYEMQTPIKAEIYAELPEIMKHDYVKFNAIDTYSAGYICSILLEVLEDLYIPYDKKGEICILVDYSF